MFLRWVTKNVFVKDKNIHSKIEIIFKKVRIINFALKDTLAENYAYL